MKQYGKLLTTALVAAALIIGVICLKNYCSCRLPNEDMGVRSVVARGHIDTLFVGSSAYRKGINMYRVSEELPGESFMLTYNGNQPFNVAIELKEIIGSGADVDLIVADFNPSMVDRGADLSDKRLLWDISMEGKRKLWSELKNREGADLFTWFDYWVSSNMDYMATYPIAKPMISKRYYLGGSADTEESAGKTAEELASLEIVENPGINDLQRSSIDEIIKLCSENDIKLIFLECPRYVLMADNENYRAKSDELAAYIEEKGIEVLRDVNLGFDNTNPGYYADLTHMSGEGSKVLTDIIIGKLK